MEGKLIDDVELCFMGPVVSGCRRAARADDKATVRQVSTVHFYRKLSPVLECIECDAAFFYQGIERFANVLAVMPVLFSHQVTSGEVDSLLKRIMWTLRLLGYSFICHIDTVYQGV